MTKRARPSHSPCGLPGLVVAFAALSATATILPADASEGPTARLQEIAAAERSAEKRWQDAQRARREYQRRSAAAHARMRMQGVSTMHASTPSPPNGAMCLAPGVEPALFSPVSFVGSAGMGSVWSNADAATSGASTRTSPIRAAEAALGLSRPSRAAPWREGVSPSLAPEGRTPSSMHPLLDTHASTPLRERSVAFLPAASREPAQRGILRLANRDSRPTIVSITAFDDTGRRFGPVALPLEAGHTEELSSSDIEQGNPIKRLPRGIGTGQDDWRLVLQSSAELDALAYAESAQGLRTPLRNIAPSPDELRHVPLFPAADGLLRLSNPGAEAVEARIRARDDAGRVSEVRASLPPGTSRWLAASALESGQGVSGALGDGTGDWRLAIHAPATVQALALSSSAGELGNLHPMRWRSSAPAPPLEGRHSAFPSANRRSPASCAPDGAQGKAECLPSSPSVASRGQPVSEDAQTAWLPAATPGEALLRIANRSPSSGTATLHQAGGTPQEPLALRLDANAAVTLTASDLELGNAAKGLAQGFGTTSGNRRVTIRSQLELDFLSYVRSPSGTVSATHDTAPRAAPNRHVVAMFPAGAGDAEGRLRLTNRSDAPATVHIKGVDDEGRASQPATLTLPASATQTLTSAQLAWGAPELDGWPGAGRGHWRLSIWSNAPLEVAGLLATPAGELANISATSSSTSAGEPFPHPIGDLNGDGKDDVLLRHVDGRWMYYPMNGRTPIESERGTVALERSANWQLAGIADMDGDGKDDILLRHTDGRWKGYLMDGKTVLDSGSIQGLPSDPAWNVAGLGDLDGNGKTDVVLRHPDGQWLHAPLDGLTVAPNIAVEPNLTKSTKWSVAGVADLNGDAKDDILLRHEDGRWHYYPMNGSLSGPGRGSVSGVTNSLDWHLAGLGDLNGDGRDDILLRHVEGRWTYHPMNGRDVMEGKGGISLTPNTAWRMASVGDLNGDGNDDALLRHEDGRWTYYPLDGRTILAGRGTAGITRNPDWSTKGPEPGPDEAEAGVPDAEDETAESVFHTSIASIVESKCATCHRDGGVSGNTRLVFAAGANQQTANLTTFEDFLAKVDEGATLILNKVQGVSHGGGIQLAAGTEGFAAMERFLSLLQGGPDGGPSVTPATLFDGVKMEPSRSTLRRAAIVFAGRIPTDAEYDAIKTGGIGSLRKAIRGLMKGPNFHEFLLRGANDQLLTDREDDPINPVHGHFVTLNNLNWDRAVAALKRSGSIWSDLEFVQWRHQLDYGIGRAPLELIAHVAENDLPYTEVLTADYIMANRVVAEGYGDVAAFNDPSNPHEFAPSEIVDYYRDCEGHTSEHDPDIGTRVFDPGPCATDYPHAGVLNTTVFLLRYPTTATNRNRARSRWTYYHFLGLDVEKSASRTTDPEALADTNNPTMHNPACTVCHSVLDPVAGAFQNYGEEGYYRDAWNGLDSLADLYKSNPPGRIDVPIAARSRQDGAGTPLGTAYLRADGANELGLKNLRTLEGDQKLHLALGEVVVSDLGGNVVNRIEVRDAADEKACGEATSDSYKLWDCGEMLVLTLDVPKDGDYHVEIDAWVREQGEKPATLQAWMPGPFYRLEDTWYRDMREPGFDGVLAPSADNSVQWLARRIATDPAFAEATVRFWWPAIMGSDVVEPPSEGDADFNGRLLASSAQAAEVQRLGGAFRRGFGSGKRYNLKDLLTGIVLSKWFRADALTEGNPVRTFALAHAGAKRLLTPEELSHKTAALTGFDWRRSKPDGWDRLADRRNWTNAERGYGLLYGGIDSDGITKRGRDFTPVMAGVANRMAAAASCPVVLKDFYLLPEAERRLFGGIDVSVSPGTAGRLTPAAERIVRRKLVELQDKLLGVVAAPDSPDIDTALSLFVEVWRTTDSGSRFPGDGRCAPHRDEHYFDGIADNIWRDELDESGRPKGWDWDRMHHFLWEETDRSDPHGLARTWMVILAYLMTDPRYLHL